MNHQNPTHIVVIGGGPAGLAFAQAAAQELPCQRKHQIKITLIEKNEFFFNTYGSLRALVDASYLPKLFIPYDNALPKDGAAKIEHAIVNHVDYSANTITFTPLPLPSKENSYTINNEDDQSIRYDYLIIATGSSYPTPIKPAIAVETREEVTQSIIEMADKIKAAESILVIGGGAVGCEMAGELKTHHPQKNVMLLDSHSELVSTQQVPNIRAPLKKALEKIGVKLHLGQKLSERYDSHQFGTKTLITEDGLGVTSDVQLVCAGMKPNISLMAEHPECLDINRKSIKVKSNMQVDNSAFDTVFVIGDCSNHPTPKMGYWGQQQGNHLGKSLVAHIRSGKKKAIKPFKTPSTEALLIPIGPEGGVSQLPMFGGIIMGDFFTRTMKAKDLMATMTWGNLNASISNWK